jgi:TRAP-type mannitol/chloroaromatic compound transport system permease small subunit
MTKTSTQVYDQDISQDTIYLSSHVDDQMKLICLGFQILELILEVHNHHNRFRHILDNDVSDKVKQIQFHIFDNVLSLDLHPKLFHEDHYRA